MWAQETQQKTSPTTNARGAGIGLGGSSNNDTSGQGGRTKEQNIWDEEW